MELVIGPLPVSTCAEFKQDWRSKSRKEARRYAFGVRYAMDLELDTQFFIFARDVERVRRIATEAHKL